jgi:hypothetical protein
MSKILKMESTAATRTTYCSWVRRLARESLTETGISKCSSVALLPGSLQLSFQGKLT